MNTAPKTASVRVLDLVVGIGCLLSGCQAPDQSSQSSADSQSDFNATEVTKGTSVRRAHEYDPNALACDPFNGTQPIYYNSGLHAEVYYLNPNQTQYTRVSDYIAHGTKLPFDIFFNQVNVPTRLFSAGFPSQAGPVFKDPSGHDLVEWFALRYDSVIRLAPGDLPGRYQFAILSDDGAVMSIDEDGSGLKTIVSNDGTHPSRFGCAAKSVRMDASSYLPIRLDYYQGPRYHIANILMWRKLADNADEVSNPSVLSDAACGVAGNDTYFNYNVTPSAPLTAYNQLLARGWKVVTPDNFVLPATNPENPCCVGPCSVGTN